MGQGNYVSVVYGVALTDEALRKRMQTDDGDWVWDDVSIPREQRLDWRETPRTAYEAKTPYVGYRVVASNGVADPQDGETDLDGLGCMRLADLPAAIEAHADKAKARWATFEAWMKTRGFDLPPADFLWVSDYD